MRLLAVATALFVGFAEVGLAQAGEADGLIRWQFDGDVGEWTSPDPTAQLAVTEDVNVTRGAEHGGVLECAYTPEVGTFSGVVAPVTTDLTGAKSLRFWLRTSEHAIVLTALNEGDGSDYHAAFSSLPERWQEIALDFSEFTLGDDSEDENGRLDPEQVQGMGLIDATAFIAQMAMEVPFLIAPDMGPRMLWLDDVTISAEGVDPRWTETQIDGKRAARLDSFESAPLQWLLLAGKGVEIDYDQDYAADGEFSLRLQYDLPPGKLMGVLTSPRGPDLSGMRRVRLWLMSEVPTTVIVGLKEEDESQYNTMIEVRTEDELALFDIDLADLQLDDDKVDENGQLDLTQVTELTIADVSAMTGNPVQVNTLWIDDIVFTE